MPGKCLRGAVIRVNLDPTVGHEQAKVRPCLVVQNDIGNARSGTTIVAPITDAEHVRRLSAIHILIRKGEGGLSKDSVILCDQIRTVDERRFRDTLGHVSDQTMAAVDEGLRISLGLPEGNRE